jgi:hypothetical protein
VTGPPQLGELVELASEDLCDAGAISRLDIVADPAASALSVTVELGDEQDRDRAAPG